MLSKVRVVLALVACVAVPSAAHAAFVDNNIMVLNSTATTQTFSAFVGLPLSPELWTFASAEGMVTVTPGQSGTATVDLVPGEMFFLTGSGNDGGWVDLGVGTGTIACVAVRVAQTCIFPLVTNTFAPTLFNAVGAQLRFTLTAGGTAAFNSRVTLETAQAPEPSLMLLFATAAAGAWRARRRTAN